MLLWIQQGEGELPVLVIFLLPCLNAVNETILEGVMRLTERYRNFSSIWSVLNSGPRSNDQSSVRERLNSLTEGVLIVSSNSHFLYFLDVYLGLGRKGGDQTFNNSLAEEQLQGLAALQVGCNFLLLPCSTEGA
jgi:hypothetical protein